MVVSLLCLRVDGLIFLSPFSRWARFPSTCNNQSFNKGKVFSEFTASLVLGFVAFFAVKYGYGTELDKIIISSVMPLVPGILITNAVRDLMAGHFMSGMAKGAEAF